ncbi:MAG: hypothetical protein NT151_06300 [Acidobacteria bacterium]|nr:hypothetical protein [Acidobacteriota bacterium]
MLHHDRQAALCGVRWPGPSVHQPDPRIEDDAHDLGPVARHARRHAQQAPAIWEDVEGRAFAPRPRFLPRSSMGKALTYFIDEYDALVGHLSDGRFE